jgi:hypothetical protein
MDTVHREFVLPVAQLLPAAALDDLGITVSDRLPGRRLPD